MQHTLQQSRLSTLLAQRNGYLILAVISSLCTLLMIALCFSLSHRERVVITPAVVNQPFWISQGHASASYLLQMTALFSSLKFTLSPDSAEAQQLQLLRFATPKFYGPFKDALVAERQKLTNEHVSTVFYPENFAIQQKPLSVTVTGDLVSIIGTTTLAPVRVAYRWSYAFSNGQLHISSLDEVPLHA